MKTFLCSLMTVGALCAGLAHAQDWPQGTVRIVVPYGPGSNPDAMARVVADRLSKNTGKTFIVENRPGAAGMIAADTVVKAPPDGNTLLASATGPINTNMLLYKKMAYNPIKDLAPIAMLGETPTILVVGNAIKATNVSELLKEMANPGNRLAYGSSGNGTQGHLSMAYLVGRSGGDVPHVPYAGSPLIISALLAGDIQMAVMPPLTVVPQIRAGKLRPIAAIGAQRHFLLPDVPTLKEQGIDLEVGGFVGLLAPAATPKPIIERIHAEVRKALQSPEVAENIRGQGMTVSTQGPAEFARYIDMELKIWGPVIKNNGIALE